MNKDGQYSVNIGTAEYPCWVPAKWIRAAGIIGFQVMRVVDPEPRDITVHSSAVKEVKPSNTALEDEMRRLLECGELTKEARNLLAAALEAQITGTMPKLDFLI